MASINSIQQSNREITVDFPISKVKESILLIFEKIPSKYTKRADSINDILNIYHFPAQNNLNPAILDISLSDIDGTKTKINISASNAVGSQSSNSILSGIVNDYLNILSKALVGDIQEFEQIQKKSSNFGCWWIVVVVLIVIVVFTLL